LRVNADYGKIRRSNEKGARAAAEGGTGMVKLPCLKIVDRCNNTVEGGKPFRLAQRMADDNQSFAVSWIPVSQWEWRILV